MSIVATLENIWAPLEVINIAAFEVSNISQRRLVFDLEPFWVYDQRKVRSELRTTSVQMYEDTP